MKKRLLHIIILFSTQFLSSSDRNNSINYFDKLPDEVIWNIATQLSEIQNNKSISKDTLRGSKKLSAVCTRFRNICLDQSIDYITQTEGISALHAAAITNQSNKIQEILEQNPHLLGSKDLKYGRSLLASAAVGNAGKIAQLIIDKRKDLIDIPDHDKATPLILAASFKSHDVANILLQHGADITKQTSYGEDAFRMAILRGDQKMIDILTQHQNKRIT
jgi:ankyrin repeat protein